jgi:hypothetical protein
MKLLVHRSVQIASASRSSVLQPGRLYRAMTISLYPRT